MKPTYSFYCDPQGVIRVIDLTGIEEPHHNNGYDGYGEDVKSYEKALEKAKQESVEAKDQEKAKALIWALNMAQVIEGTINLKPDTIYHIPRMKVEIQDQINFHGKWIEITYNIDKYLGYQKRKLAIISVDERKTEEESQAELWDEVYRTMTGAVAAFLFDEYQKKLQDKFTIKRKQ